MPKAAPSEFRDEISRIIRREVHIRHIPPHEVAKKIGVSKRMMRGFMSGENIPTLVVMLRLIRVFNLDLDELMACDPAADSICVTKLEYIQKVALALNRYVGGLKLAAGSKSLETQRLLPSTSKG